MKIVIKNSNILIREALTLYHTCVRMYVKHGYFNREIVPFQK